MRFSALQRRVTRCEQVMAVRLTETQDHWSSLSRAWRAGWSPLRIIVVGVAAGFVAGKMELPTRSAGASGARWLQMIGSVSNLVASAQAAFASAMAAHAAGTADEAATQADVAAEKADDATVAAGSAAAAAHARPTASADERTPPTASAHVPRPAEAATELSER